MQPINNLLKKFPREFQLSREVYQLVNKLSVNDNCRLIEVFRKTGKCRSTCHWYMNSLSRYFVLVFVAVIISVVFNKILKLRTIATIRRKLLYHDATLQLSQVHLIEIIN